MRGTGPSPPMPAVLTVDASTKTDWDTFNLYSKDLRTVQSSNVIVRRGV
jgi:hypothetical protein